MSWYFLAAITLEAISRGVRPIRRVAGRSFYERHPRRRKSRLRLRRRRLRPSKHRILAATGPPRNLAHHGDCCAASSLWPCTRPRVGSLVANLRRTPVLSAPLSHPLVSPSTSYTLSISAQIPLAFLITEHYVSSPFITGPTFDGLRGHHSFPRREERAMVMKSGERWHCIDRACGCAVLVESNGGIEGQNPRCACGRVMKKDYSPPCFSHLQFLRLPDQALTHSEFPKD